MFLGPADGAARFLEGPLHGVKSPGYLAEKTNHECGWHRDRDEGFDGPFPAGKRHGVFRGSTAHQKIFLFLHRWEQINFKTMFRRGAYLAEHTLQAASVEFVPRRGTNYARSRLPKFVGKACRGFSTVSRKARRPSFFIPLPVPGTPPFPAPAVHGGSGPCCPGWGSPSSVRCPLL